MPSDKIAMRLYLNGVMMEIVAIVTSSMKPSAQVD